MKQMHNNTPTGPLDDHCLKTAFSAMIAGWIVFLWATGASAQAIVGSAHDFSSQAWSGGTFCTPCHSARAGWNHELSNQHYTLSDSSTLDAIDLGQPKGISAECLSCHDGAVALDSFGGRTGGTFISPAVQIGPDLGEHHPVSFTYDAALAAIDGGLRDPSTAESGLGGTIADDMLEAGKLQCSACHDPHALGGYDNLLVAPIDGAALCTTCHTGSGPDSHHIPGRGDPWSGFGCTLCHGTDLLGDLASGAPACTDCHSDFAFPDPPPSGHHIPGRDDPLGTGNCTLCHGGDLTGDVGPSCFTCHDQLWDSGPPANRPPVADPAGPYAGAAGATGAVVQFDGSASADPDGAIASYDWDFGDGTSGSGAHPTHSYAAEGVYTVELTVTGDAGLTHTATTTADISAPANLPPIVNPGGPYSGTAGQPIRFDASGTTGPEPGDSLLYMWRFGDGQISRLTLDDPTAQHSYAAPGTYDAQLTVADPFHDPVTVDFQVVISGTAGPEPDDAWIVRMPLLGDGADFTMDLEHFGEILVVRTTYAGGPATIGIGAEFGTTILWMDSTESIFVGNIDRGAGTMSGIVLDYNGGGTVWFAERF